MRNDQLNDRNDLQLNSSFVRMRMINLVFINMHSIFQNYSSVSEIHFFIAVGDFRSPSVGVRLNGLKC